MKITRLTDINPKIIQQIIELHTKLLPNSLLVLLDKKHLEKIYKNEIINPKEYLIVVEEKNKVIGFGLLTTENSTFIYRIIRELIHSLLEVIPLTILKQPSLIFWLPYSILLHTSKKYSTELHFLVVKKEYQHQGVGTKLIKYLERQLKKDGYSNYTLKTLTTNKKANHFYQKHGFTLINSQKFMGKSFNNYLKQFDRI